jgi:hypothetical protein
MKFNPPNGLLRLELTLEHRRERNVQGFADLEQARCADAVSAALILLNLLKRDAQQFTEALLAHVDCAPAFAHPSPIYWSTALASLGDFVFRFAFFIRPLALDQLEVQ